MSNSICDESDIKEFLEHGYTEEEIEQMSDDEFVYTAVALVDGMSKEEIDKSLGKPKKETSGCIEKGKTNLNKPNYDVLIKKESIFFKG